MYIIHKRPISYIQWIVCEEPNQLRKKLYLRLVIRLPGLHGIYNKYGN